MIYGSVCSGIEAATVAWEPLGWKAAFFAEIEAFPSAVLAHRFPHVPNLGDFTRIGKDEPCAAIDLLVGGTPCQAFSVAGLRAGLADPRGNLALEFLALADRLRPRWLVWENVPGVLSSLSDTAPDPTPPPPPVDVERKGQTVETEDEADCEELHALNCFLAALSELGYGWAMRVLDAQYFDLAQRRARVFVVAHLGDWQPAAAVLLEPESMRGDSPPSREQGQGPARPLSSSPAGGSGYRNDADTADNLIAKTLLGEGHDRGRDDDAQLVVARPLTASPHGYRSDSETETLVAHPLLAKHNDSHDESKHTYITAFHGAQDPDPSGDVTHPLGQNGGLEACIAFDTTQITHPENRSNPQPGDPRPSLSVGAHPPAIAYQCEGPQTFDWQAGASGDDSFRGKSRSYIADQPGRARALTANRTLAVAYSNAMKGDGDSEAAIPADVARCLDQSGGFAPNQGGTVVATAFQERGRTDGRSLEIGGDVAYALTAPNGGGRSQELNVATSTAVRRLTPRECERLQGFPDDWTLVPWRSGSAPDGPRYRAIGNSMATHVMRWIGERIDTMDRILQEASR